MLEDAVNERNRTSMFPKAGLSWMLLFLFAMCIPSGTEASPSQGATGHQKDGSLPQEKPVEKRPIDPDRSLKFMTFNVLFEGGDSSKNLSVIREVSPDVVCLTELTPGFAAQLRQEFATEYPHLSFFPKEGTWGVGLMSKFKLSKTRSFAQKPHRMPAVEAGVKTPQGLIQVECIHLFPPVAKRKKSDSFLQSIQENEVLRTQQAAAILARVDDVKNPVVVLGDFNEGRGSGAVGTLLTGGFVHACLHSDHCGPTWPGATSSMPAVVEIDHILARGLDFTDARVVKAGGSDHYPVVATASVPSSKSQK